MKPIAVIVLIPAFALCGAGCAEFGLMNFAAVFWVLAMTTFITAPMIMHVLKDK